MPALSTSSMMEFHSPQASQRPTQRFVIAPQDWQTNVDFLRAMTSSSSAPVTLLLSAYR